MNDDLMDRYIEQSLKNWAAQKQPQAGKRSQLLLIAASQDREQAAIPGPDLQAVKIYSPWLYRVPSQAPMGPVSQSRLWPLFGVLAPYRSLCLS
jgi:hypothetical protein